MKLKNKKTGEIAKLVGYVKIVDGRVFFRFEDDKGSYKKEYNSLAELNEDWEDYEEPKEYWFIDFNGEIKEFEVLDFEWQGWMKEIGNYFSSREEAEKAVEKLKAWKRLKDKGFKFEGIAGMGNEIYFKANEQFTHIMVDEYTADKTEKEYIDDLMLLFGGKE